MADSELIDLTEDTTPSGSDIGYSVKDPAGSPVDRKVTWLNVIKGALSGVFSFASSSGPASLAFHEDTDNGTNKTTLQGAASQTADQTITLPNLTGTVSLATMQYVVGDKSGNHTTTSASYGDVNAAYSLSVPAVAGDRIEIELTCSVFHSSATATSYIGASVAGTDLTAGVINADTLVANEAQPVTYRMVYVVQSGDISGGNVAVKARWKTSASTFTMLNSSTDNRSPVFTVKNWKQ